MVVVRRVRPDEGGALRDVRLAALADAPGAFASTYEKESVLTADDWAERAQKGSSGSLQATFLAVRGAHVVGLVGGFRWEPDLSFVHLVSMWTDPVVRRSGVGKALIAAALDWSRSSDARSVELWVARDNPAAANLYASMGFVDTGDYQPFPSDPGKDEQRMRLVL